MRVVELIERLNDFGRRLREHRALWGRSLGILGAGRPERNIGVLQQQSHELVRLVGQLRPYLGGCQAFCVNSLPDHLVTRPSNTIAKWLRAALQSLTGRLQRSEALVIARYSTLRTESSVGNAPRLLVTFRIDALIDSMAFVV